MVQISRSALAWTLTALTPVRETLTISKQAIQRFLHLGYIMSVFYFYADSEIGRRSLRGSFGG